MGGDPVAGPVAAPEAIGRTTGGVASRWTLGRLILVAATLMIGVLGGLFVAGLVGADAVVVWGCPAGMLLTAVAATVVWRAVDGPVARVTADARRVAAG